MTLFRISSFISALVLWMVCLSAGQAVERLWPLGAPGSRTTNPADTVNNPYLALYTVSSNTANGAAIVVCPGGGYTSLSAFTKEGVAIAKWLNTLGISAFVLRYRLGNSTGSTTSGYQHPVEMWDGQRAMRWVRANAARFGIDVHRVGIAGFSAGGHLASTVATHYDFGNPDTTSINHYPGTPDSIDKFSCRPDFQILGYPVITMDATFTHAGSRTALLGTSPSAALVLLMSNEKQVTADTPPAFLVHTTNDGTVPVKNSQVYSDSLQKKSVVHKLLIYPMGNHGFGLADGQNGAPSYMTPPNDVFHWTDSARVWMVAQGYLTKPTAILPRGHNLPTGGSINNEVLDLLGRESERPHGRALKTPIPEH